MPESAVVIDFAPQLLFHRSELHLPGRPEQFRQNARFRQSNFEGRKDRGWNKAANGWEANNNHGPDYWDVDWLTILQTIKAETASLRPGGPTPDGEITRPRDPRNMWRDDDSVRGFYLELKEGFGRDRSGAAPHTQLPIFHDTHHFDLDGTSWTALTYWFFYVYNWHVFLAHEGDWEHISLYFHKNEFTVGGVPRWVYFAAHGGGRLLRWTDSRINRFDGSHPSVYVSRWGHPSYPTVHNPGEYTVSWNTWEQAIPSIETFEWQLFDGAWGEVGSSVHGTGPLGPFFKRYVHLDPIRARRSP